MSRTKLGLGLGLGLEMQKNRRAPPSAADGTRARATSDGHNRDHGYAI